MKSVKVVFERVNSRTQVALRNVVLSYRGSLREAHCAITWVMKLNRLVQAGADANNVIKEYNKEASSGSALTGQKRTSVMALLKAPH